MNNKDLDLPLDTERVLFFFEYQLTITVRYIILCYFQFIQFIIRQYAKYRIGSCKAKITCGAVVFFGIGHLNNYLDVKYVLIRLANMRRVICMSKRDVIDIISIGIRLFELQHKKNICCRL